MCLDNTENKYKYYIWIFMFKTIPNEQALNKNRHNLQKMLADEYPRMVNETMVKLVTTTKEHGIEMEQFVVKYMNNIRHKRTQQMLYLDAYYYIFPVERKRRIDASGLSSQNPFDVEDMQGRESSL